MNIASQRVKEWRIKNPLKLKKLRRQYQQKHRLEINEKEVAKRAKNPEKYRLRDRKKYWKNPEVHKARFRRWKKKIGYTNSGSWASIELQIAMNNVRKRDSNACQWQDCGLTQREAPIHVHHIFLRSEYPELELIEKFMICYCANHHGLWHRYRGDKVANIMTPKGYTD